MRTLFVDLETFSATPIEHGVHAYARDPRARILLVAWARGNEEVRVDEGVTPEFLATLQAAERVVMHNCGFDRVVLREVAGVDIPLERIEDTMALALLHNLPARLGELGAALGAEEDERKARTGRALIRLFCVPAEDGQPRGSPDSHPEQWQRFREYAAQDVRALQVIWRRCPRWNQQPREREIWLLDQVVNDRGVPVDVKLAQRALEVGERVAEQLAVSARRQTDGYLTRSTQRARFLQVLQAAGVELEDARAPTLERALQSPDLPPGAAELIRNRLAASLSSPRKYRRVVEAAVDGRLRGTLQYCGAARTGRWSGRLFQPQNLPRVDERWAAQHAGWLEALLADPPVLEQLETLVPSAHSPGVMWILSQLLRSVVAAPPGRRLVGADLSNIEGRVLAWLAGERWKLEAFRAADRGEGPDLYRVTAGRILRKRPEEVTKEERQTRGKVPELACGFGGGQGAFGVMAKLYGLEYPPTQVDAIIREWRAANPRIVALWYALQDAFVGAVAGQTHRVSGGLLTVDRHGAYVRVRLPSGRFLQYLSPKRDDKGEWVYLGVNPVTRRWVWNRIYGGKLVENVVQAVARDILAEGMLRAEAAGFPVVLTVHDEVLTETPDAPDFTGARLAELLRAQPEWAAGLPLAAVGWHGDRWAKG